MAETDTSQSNTNIVYLRTNVGIKQIPTIDYITAGNQSLDDYLKKDNAEATYLKISDAKTTYTTFTWVSDNYLQKTDPGEASTSDQQEFLYYGNLDVFQEDFKQDKLQNGYYTSLSPWNLTFTKNPYDSTVKYLNGVELTDGVTYLIDSQSFTPPKSGIYYLKYDSNSSTDEKIQFLNTTTASYQVEISNSNFYSEKMPMDKVHPDKNLYILSGIFLQGGQKYQCYDNDKNTTSNTVKKDGIYDIFYNADSTTTFYRYSYKTKIKISSETSNAGLPSSQVFKALVEGNNVQIFTSTGSYKLKKSGENVYIIYQADIQQHNSGNTPLNPVKGQIFAEKQADGLVWKGCTDPENETWDAYPFTLENKDIDNLFK